MNCEACGHPNIDGARFCAKCGVLMPVPTSSDDPLIGQLVGGRFRIVAVLGEGGMGKVYVGEQQMGTTVRKVAVKTLHPHLSKDPSVLARFHRECGTVAGLEHPNTIKFYDFGATQDGTLYIAMEFVDGRSLMDAIEASGALSPERTFKIMKQVCGALDEAHRQGVIHRDLKPENIILTDRAGEVDFVKVLDFGIAARSDAADEKKEQKLTQQGMVLGTPPYMSPEQFTGKALDQRSDIYSLGVMAYEMLTGKLPFDADTPWQWATQHMTAQPTPFEVASPAQSLPASARQAILRALSKDREERQSSAREFYEQLSGGGGLTVEASALSAPLGAEAGGATPPTAAMAAMPQFGGGAAAPAAPQYGPPPGAAPLGPAGAGAPAYPADSPGFVPLPPAPPGPSGKGRGVGLIIGLIGLLGVLAVAIAVVLLRSKPKDEDRPLTLDGPVGATSAATVAPVEPTAPTATQAAATDTATVEPPPPPTPPTTKPPSTPKPPTTTPPPSGAACTACLSAASSGNIIGAATNYAKCTDAGQKASCSSVVRSKAAPAAKAAALNGNCSQAKAIAAAAQGMGAGSPALSSALSTCK